MRVSVDSNYCCLLSLNGEVLRAALDTAVKLWEYFVACAGFFVVFFCFCFCRLLCKAR